MRRWVAGLGVFGAAMAALGPLASCSRTGLPLTHTELTEGGIPTEPEASKPVGCQTGMVTLFRASPAVMFVLDRSGSMGTPLGTTGQSRWQVLRQALAATLPPVDASMSIGALLYPKAGATGNPTSGSACVVPSADLAPSPGNVAALVAKMASTSPGGGTPTAAALDAAASVLLGLRAASTARAVVLATDGAPNCNAALSPKSCICVTGGTSCGLSGLTCLDDVRTVKTIASHAAQGIPTYVIGIEAMGDSQFSGVLDAMADAGGRPRQGTSHHYYAVGSEADLKAALTAIRDQVGLCTYLTTSVPDEGGTIAVSIDGETLDEDPSGVEGWSWGDRKNGEIVFHGDACAKAATAVAPVADVQCAEP